VFLKPINLVCYRQDRSAGALILPIRGRITRIAQIEFLLIVRIGSYQFVIDEYLRKPIGLV